MYYYIKQKMPTDKMIGRTPKNTSRAIKQKEYYEKQKEMKRQETERKIKIANLTTDEPEYFNYCW